MVGLMGLIPSGKQTAIQLFNMAIEIVSFPMKNCDFPYSYVSLPESTYIYVGVLHYNRLYIWYVYPTR